MHQEESKTKKQEEKKEKKMKRILAVSITMFLLFCGISTAQADVIAYTGFEEPAASTSKYTQSGTPGSALPTQSGVTTSYAGGNELGFETYLIDGSGPSVGSESGDYIGVSDYYAYNGNNGYEMEDVDNQVQLVIETVDLTGWTDVTVSSYVKFKLNSYSDYENSDRVAMYVLTDVGTFTLFDLEGEDALDDHAEEYTYFHYSVDIDDSATWATLVLDVTTNGSGEGAMVDDIYFNGSPVPVPGAVWLLGSGLLAAVGLRRKNR
jgi:hypothetical protein